MFNIAKDISETADIAQNEPAKRKELAKDLSQWIESSGSRMPKKNPKR